ncbi:hypothetical protein PoB_002803800 [Plakobranchus ocellatus]|uniref:MADF domain-containing protein n=1 Tax=Plakobranchus ocellatus TaxID=259542 RepID=A0AAV4A4A8_9GAST|nr:hypothetical protein PoB_002803800 [Plakobranchus ocellatus]
MFTQQPDRLRHIFSVHRTIWLCQACQTFSGLCEKVEVVKKRWTYLRDYYRKQKKFLGEAKSGQAAVKKIKWPVFDAMSFVETFAECSQTHTNFEKPGPLANIELESTSKEDSQEQLTQVGLDTSSGQQLRNAAATDALPPPLSPSRKRKKPDSNSLDFKILAALKEPDNNDNPDGHFSFWKGIQPMLKQLNSLEALKFKHEVRGLLISYIERSQAKSSHFPTVHTVHPSSFPETHSYRTSIQPSPIPSPSPTPSSLESHAEYEQNGPPRPPYHEEQYYQF